MASDPPRSIRDIDFKPIAGKTYWSSGREWREEFIYFLMVDRFHDGRNRTPSSGPGRSRGYGTFRELSRFCGGTIAGITRNLDYIRGLGCTALWLSPIFENDDAPRRDSDKYHGYAIRNYLAVDPRFGTLEDFKELVEEAHRRDMNVFLDAVANHSGDVWCYPGDQPYRYADDSRQYPFGGWRSPDYPVPVELRNPEYYHRRGMIREWGWDRQPETLWGDFFSLKGFNNDETPAGLELQEIIIDCHRYWVRETDIDGYRMDAVKHMGERAVARFCQSLREYAKSLGKRRFFLFGELVAGDDAINRYTGPNTEGVQGDRTIHYGLDSVLDFSLYWVLPGVIKDLEAPDRLMARYEALREHALSRGELGRYLITFLDSHDQVGQDYKRRFGAGAHDEQIIAGAGYLICALGTPCLYYGTEQGFSGEGDRDTCIREAMFDLQDPSRSALNPECRIYRGISAIAAVNRRHPPLRFGRMYFREVSADGQTFRLPGAFPSLLSFSRILAKDEVLVAYNPSTTERRRNLVMIDASLHRPGDALSFLYGDQGSVTVRAHPGPAGRARCVELDLAPMQFVILA
jgi:alpha-amylase